MFDDLRSTRGSDCKVCYGQHNDEIHDATLRVRGWMHHEVTRKLMGDAPDMEEEDPALVA